MTKHPPSKSTSARRLLTTTYHAFDPVDLGDRYVRFLLENETTMKKLLHCVLEDHRDDHDASNTIGQHVQHNGNPRRRKNNTNDSIEIDAFQLIACDPILGNLTLRYPDTLLGLLEDSTVQARRVLRRRMEMAMKAGLECGLSHSSSQQHPPQEQQLMTNIQQQTNQQLLTALQSNSTYHPIPLRPRLTHLPPHTTSCKPTLSSISSTDVGTILQIHGTCLRTSPIRMMETTRRYRCLNKECCHEFYVGADFGTSHNALPMPTVCPARYEDYVCGGNNFAMVEGGSAHLDYQEMKIQECAGALSRVGSVPRSLTVKMTGDLVDVCHPGDEVVVVGALHAEWSNGAALGDDLEVRVGMALEAHSVRVVNAEEEVMGGSSSVDLGGLMGGVFGSASGNLRERFCREFDAFWSQEVAKNHPIGTRDYILRAVCPKLYGMHAVKLGLLLALIGGASVSTGAEQCEVSEDGEMESENNNDSVIHEQTEAAGPVAFQIGGGDNADIDEDMESKPKRKKIGSGNQNGNNSPGKAVRSRRRTQSHILLIGDPGTGKSQFLRFAAALSPRSVLTTGTGSSTAGLTCAAVKDSGNEFSLEAGALALADRGVCCIDEFGCMSKEDRTSIHEAMEQQTISVAKAGIVCKLNARATVVAVMNPSGGIYSHDLSLENNARLGSALLSRFDLIFIMLDQAQSERDAKIAHFLLQQSISPGSGYDRPIDIEKNLNDGDTNGHWSMEKLRAYVAIVREKFHPKMTKEASQLLERHYNLCRQSKTEKSLPITVRFLESLIRLSQAHARLMYRNEVLLDDALAVILLMECTATAYQNNYDTDDFMFRNPIDTPFPPFDSADEEFDDEKKRLLEIYENTRGRGPSQHPFTPNHHFNGGTQRDQWGRQMISQIDLTQNPPSQGLNEARDAMAMMDQDVYTPPSDFSPHANDSSNQYAHSTQNVNNNIERVTISRQFIPDQVSSNHPPPRSHGTGSSRKHRRTAD